MTKTDNKNSTASDLPPVSEPLIRVKNLIAKYGEKTILDDITVDIFPQEITVILGGSGCGKTTLLKNILQLQKPASGIIEIFDKDVTQLTEIEYEEVLKRIGVLFQNGALLNSVDIYENVSIPIEQHTTLPEEIRRKIIEVKVSLVNLSHALYLKPSELSGGMRKRAALARAIALDPEILFCDEPSAGLDPVSSASLDELILNLKNQLKMTVLIVTHELASIHRIADKIIFLDAGKMLFNGTVEDAKKSGIEPIETFFKVGSF